MHERAPIVSLSSSSFPTLSSPFSLLSLSHWKGQATVPGSARRPPPLSGPRICEQSVGYLWSELRQKLGCVASSPWLLAAPLLRRGRSEHRRRNGEEDDENLQPRSSERAGERALPLLLLTDGRGRAGLHGGTLKSPTPWLDGLLDRTGKRSGPSSPCSPRGRRGRGCHRRRLRKFYVLVSLCYVIYVCCPAGAGLASSHRTVRTPALNQSYFTVFF